MAKNAKIWRVLTLHSYHKNLVSQQDINPSFDTCVKNEHFTSLAFDFPCSQKSSGLLMMSHVALGFY